MRTYNALPTLILLLFFTAISCKKKAEETPAPTLKISSSSAGDAATGNAKTGETVTIILGAAALEGIKELSAFKVVSGAENLLPGYPKTSGFDTDKAHVWSFTYTVTEMAGEVNLKFLIGDKAGKTASVTYKITVSPIPAPTIQMISNSLGSSLTDGSAERGLSLSFDLLAKASGGIKSISVTKTVGGTETMLPGYPKTSGFTTDSTHAWKVNYTADDAVGTVTFTFEVVNSAGASQAAGYTLTITAPQTPNSYTAKLLGAQTNAAGSFFSSQTGEVYFSSQSSTFEDNKVDISFAQTGSPVTFPKFISLSERANEGLSSVTGINRTTLFEALPASQMDLAKFDALTNVGIKNLEFTGSPVIQVTNGTFYAYKNTEGKKGVIHVFELDEGFGTNGYVKFDVKFEK